MKKRLLLVLAVVFLSIGIVACGGDGDGGASGGPPRCESPAQGIVAGNTYREHIDAATEYPDNCVYFCMDVPSGQDNLTLRIWGYDTDLDIYVGRGGLNSVQGDDAGQWYSNAGGTADEEVVIDSPSSGTYYIEVCSYMGEASDFQLEAELR